MLLQCFLHFLLTASTLACLLPFSELVNSSVLKFPLIWAAGRYKSLIPTTPLPSSHARANLISYNIKVTEVGPYRRRRYVLIPTSHFLILTERTLHYSVHKSQLMVHKLMQMNPVYNGLPNF